VFPSRSQRAANSILAHALALGYTSGSPSADAYYAEQAAALGWTPGDRSLALTRSDGEAIAIAAVVVRELFGRTPAAEFGPKKLKAVRQAMIERRWCRNTVHAQIDRVTRMFKWAVAEEMIAASAPEGGEGYGTIRELALPGLSKVGGDYGMGQDPDAFLRPDPAAGTGQGARMSQIAEIIEGRPLIHAESSERVRDVARRMTKENVGAVAVLDSGRLVGVFSERDVMSRVVAEGLDPDKTLISNVMTKDIVVADPEVFRLHCAIEVSGPRALVVDLGTTNGTFVDGKKIKSHELQHLSEFRIGASTLLFTVTDKDSPPA